MGNKEDWEEIEKWQKEHEEKMVNNYGTDFKEPKFHKPRKISIAISKFMDNFVWGVCYFLIAMLVLITIVAIVVTLKNWRTITNINVVEDLSARYSKNMVIISKEIDKDDNGTYILAPKKKKEIVFTAIKNGAALANDYSDICHKYFFTNWISENKQFFKVKSTENNGLLEFETYIEINNYEEIPKAVEKMQEFISFTGDWYFPEWNLYYKTKNSRIYPVWNSNTPLEDTQSEYTKIENKDTKEK